MPERRAAKRGPGVTRRPTDAGFSLLEAIIGTIIAVIAILGLAHSFGVGRALISRYEVSRAAMAMAQRRMETLSVAGTSGDLAAGSVHSAPFSPAGTAIGTEGWRVEWFDDPVDGSPDADPHDLRKVTVTVSWGTGFDADSVVLTRLFPAH